MCGSRQWLFRVTYFIFEFLQYYAVRVTVRESSLDVVQGDSITLPCSFFTMNPLIRLSIIWTLTPFSDQENPTQVIVYDQGQVIESPSFTGRVGFTDIPWNADIVLNETRISDTGIYRCVVSNPPETGDPGIGELSLRVLVPPSLPVCMWEGDTDVGSTVTLTCLVTEGIPIPVISWEKLEPDHITLPICAGGESKGVVQIANMSSWDSGVYRCSVTNALGTRNCYVKLTVYTPTENAPGLLQGVLISLSMGLVLLTLLALVLWLHRSAQESIWRDRRVEECYNEIANTPSLIKRSFV
ncbi:immunoglobulin superfamily member 11 [Tachysurus vachellii]|uniref:immunoglobulin superfamily member 11 n=1 Tax=Tachysurus vachellii TaxID=175792 RepID=UPI00296A9361|nr:immunoglobulin superfamily member 11 [Tachysurus vachellii]